VKSKRDDLHARLIDVLPPLFRRIQTNLPTEIAGVGKVTFEQYLMLSHLVKVGPCSMGELASARGIALNSATALIDRLVSAGLVERAHDEVDRRVVRVAATGQSAELVARLRLARRAAFRTMLEGLDEGDVDALVAAIPALERVSGAVSVR
jgi:DNA-binding MarR family transcriptional regulator